MSRNEKAKDIERYSNESNRSGYAGQAGTRYCYT